MYSSTFLSLAIIPKDHTLLSLNELKKPNFIMTAFLSKETKFFIKILKCQRKSKLKNVSGVTSDHWIYRLYKPWNVDYEPSEK